MGLTVRGGESGPVDLRVRVIYELEGKHPNQTISPIYLTNQTKLGLGLARFR